MIFKIYIIFIYIFIGLLVGRGCGGEAPPLLVSSEYIYGGDFVTKGFCWEGFCHGAPFLGRVIFLGGGSSGGGGNNFNTYRAKLLLSKNNYAKKSIFLKMVLMHVKYRSFIINKIYSQMEN